MEAFIVIIVLLILGFLAFLLLRLMFSHGGTILKFLLRVVILPIVVSAIVGVIAQAITGDTTVTTAGALGTYIATAITNKNVFNA